MIEFQTTQERHIDGIVAMLAKLYDGKPIGSIRIGQAYGLNHHQVLMYLHIAERRKLVRRVSSRHGWEPNRG